jgi:DNA polymerase I-like protein with 3'-5' exonuclease and polymerase domains
MNTLYLFDHLKAKLEEMDPGGRTGLHGIYDIERRCIIVTMEMERNMCIVDVPYFQKLREEVSDQLEDIKSGIYKEAGQVFNINSGDQLGEILFNKMGIKYPVAEKNTKGGYLTGEEVLDKVKENKIVGLILKLREREKILGTYIDNFLMNVDEDGLCKFQLKQTAADTGRFSSSGGDGLHVDGYAGVNCQNIPAPDPKQKDGINIRKGVRARPGYKMVSIDYSGEELRIAANLSGEKKWVDEFLYGKGDLHSVTASVIYGSTPADMMLPENKGKRGIGKSVNFLTLYGGGPGRLADVAKIPLEEAKGIIAKFYEGVPQLKDWLEKEGRRAMKRGYALTSFGRRRPLDFFFKDKNDRMAIQAGLRRACNGAIQGCLSFSSRVLTDKGYIRIGEVYARGQKGEQFSVWTGHAWAPFHALNRGACERAEIRMSNGHRIDCDTRHQVLVVGENSYVFRKYEDLAPGDQICMSPYSEKEFGAYPQAFASAGSKAHNRKDLSIAGDDKSLWDELAWLLGVYTGDGFVSPDKGMLTLCFGKKKVEELLPRLKSLMKKLGIEVCDPRRSSGSIGESYSVSMASQSLLELFEYLGAKKAPAREKTIPECIWASPVAMRKAFLRGYWDTDGSKKRINRYSFHTPNYELLREVAALGRTLGLSSRISVDRGGAYCLNWSDLCKFEKVLGTTKATSPYRTMSKESVVPPFMLKQCVDVLSPVLDRKVHKDRALLLKLRKGDRVLVSTVLMLCEKYGVEPPQLYETSAVVSKKALGYEEETYTLSVQDAGHRFDSEGVIHKNTGADVIKIALYRVWKYIRNGGYQDEVRIMMPIHDEIMFEVRADLLDKHIPRLIEVMQLKDIMQGKLKWAVPFITDAEYGDTMYVNHNYLEEKKEEAARAAAESGEASPVGQQAQEGAPMEGSAGNVDMSLKAKDARVLDSDKLQSLEELLGPKEVHMEDGVLLMSNASDSPYYDYLVCKDDEIAKRQADTIWAVLDAMNRKAYAVGPKKRIRLIKDNVVVHKTIEEYSVDAFLALALNYLI